MTSEKYILKNKKLALRELSEQDSRILTKWLSNPQVLAYYEGRDQSFDEQMVREKFYACDSNSTNCIIEYAGEKIGYIQFYPLDKEELEAYGYALTDKIFYGTDQFIGEPQYWNKGIGTELMQAISHYLFTEKKAEKIILDPHCKNKRAIACYEKCGFKKIKKLSAHELHEGVWEDCWMMEMNAF